MRPHYAEYINCMPVIATDQHRGRLHHCPICGAEKWSVWAHAEKHWYTHTEAERQDVLRRVMAAMDFDK